MSRNWERDFEERPARSLFKTGIYAIAIVAGLTVVGSLAGLVTLPFTTGTQIIQKTLDSTNVINNYEWFKRQYADVVAIDQRIVASESALNVFNQSAGDRSTWTFEDKQEFSRLNSVILGLKGQRTSMVAEYNSRSQMANRSLFKTNDLPDQLN